MAEMSGAGSAAQAGCSARAYQVSQLPGLALACV